MITFNNTNVLGSAGGQPPDWELSKRLADYCLPTDITGASPTAHQLINNAGTAITIPGGATTLGNTTTYVGLPVIGFALVSFANGTLVVGSPPVAVLSNYGGDFRHKNNTTMQ